MTNLVKVRYAQTGKSSNTDEPGMREMQAMVYAQRNRHYLPAKAPGFGKELRDDVCRA